MNRAILGKKIGMTQIFVEDGRLLPVTVVEAGPNTVVQKKTSDKDGYEAIQVGFEELTESRGKKLLNRPEQGHLKKAGVGSLRNLREFRLDDISGFEVGSVIRADIFNAGDIVDVSGMSKGKGTQGPIRRWNQHRGPMAHGSKYHRGPGAMSANSDPSRVFKNKKLAGRMGHEATTVLNIEVVRVDPERNLMLLKGALPGNNGSLVVIRNAVRKK